MKREVSLTITERYRKRFPDLSFGIGTIRDCTFFEKSETFKIYKRDLVRKTRRRDNLAQVQERIAHYDRFFNEWGYPCPLPGHLKKVIDMGFPIINLYIDAHIIAETSHGILMAIQDLDRFRGDWRLDLARQGEAYQAVSGKEYICKDDEIVLRDEEAWSAPCFKVRIFVLGWNLRAGLLWFMSTQPPASARRLSRRVFRRPSRSWRSSVVAKNRGGGCLNLESFGAVRVHERSLTCQPFISI